MAAPYGLQVVLFLLALTIQLEAAAIRNTEPRTSTNQLGEEALEEALQSPLYDWDAYEQDLKNEEVAAEGAAPLPTEDKAQTKTENILSEKNSAIDRPEEEDFENFSESENMENTLRNQPVKDGKQNYNRQENTRKDNPEDSGNEEDLQAFESDESAARGKGEYEFRDISEENNSQGQEYDGYGSEETDERASYTATRGDEYPFSMAHQKPFTSMSFTRTGDVHAVDDGEKQYDVHDDVKRGDEFMNVPGFAPVRVIELNETIYLNKTDDSGLPEFQPVHLPEKFEDYDVNKDQLISLPELRYVSGATEGAKQAFQDADLDGDGWVDRAEFKVSGWGVPVDDSPTPYPQNSVIFVPKENIRPSSIPRGSDDVKIRRSLPHGLS